MLRVYPYGYLRRISESCWANKVGILRSDGGQIERVVWYSKRLEGEQNENGVGQKEYGWRVELKEGIS